MATNSFFYGETPSPEANTVDQLIDSLNEKLQEAEGAKDSAETAATSAATSAANAATSQSAAFTASQQAVTSAISATNAANSSSASATASLASSLAAATSEGNASISADNAASSESAALASQVATAALYDQFDDRYLGSKATDPTLDNDGNALTDGALYFDTTLNVMKVYDLGTTAWVRTIPTTSDQANINTVTTNVADVTTVAGSIANVNTTAGSIANVNTTASNIANVNTVAGISANVTTVATNNANVTTVASNIGNVNTVGGISANVTTVAGISSDVTTVASNITDVQNAEENADAAILAASQAATSASNASTSASQASGFAVQSSNSATASATSATAAANSATASAASASAASDSAETAAAATNAVLWVSGTTYAIGFLVYSPLDNRVYRRLTAGAGTTDPSADATNWVQLTRVVEQSDIGTAPNEIPLNQYLGSMAYQSSESAIIESGRIDLKGGGSNLYSYSQELDNAAWGKANVTATANATTAPDGTTTAENIVPTASNVLHLTNQSIVIQPTVSATISVYAKASGYDFIALVFSTGSVSVGRESLQVFDLSTGTVATSYNTAPTSASIVDVGDGWYRCSATWSHPTVAISSEGFWPVPSDQNPRTAYTGDGTSGVYLWGAQLEQSTTVGNYVETEATSAPFNNVLGATALSVIPTNGFDTTFPLAFELASDTSLVVKVKGSDGTVRSATLTLA
jgi:trimeric autotransporter adhesin